MFSFIEDSIVNALDIVDDLSRLELPEKTAIAKLVSDGLSVYAVAEMTGLAVEVVEKIVQED